MRHKFMVIILYGITFGLQQNSSLVSIKYPKFLYMLGQMKDGKGIQLTTFSQLKLGHSHLNFNILLLMNMKIG